MCFKLFKLLTLLSLTLQFSTVSASFTTPTQTLETDQRTIDYHLTGQENEPLAIILGGGPGFTSWNLEPIQKQVSQSGYQSLLMDMIGIGENKAHRPAPILKTWIEQIHSVQTHLQSEKVTLIGHSWGALMAMKYALAYPEAVERLILINPVDPNKSAMTGLTETIHHRDQTERAPAWDDNSAWDNSVKPLTADALQRLTRKQLTQVLPTYFHDYQQGQGYAAQFSAVDFDPVLNVEAWKAYDRDPVTYEAMNTLSLPVHVIGCQQDPFMPYSLNALNQNLDLASETVLDRCGHFPWIERPKEFTNRLHSVLSNAPLPKVPDYKEPK